MADKHAPEIPVDLETVVSRLGELEVVLGSEIGPLLAEVRTTLIAAMAARDRGDLPAALGEIGRGMDRLTTAAERLDPAEAALMRALAQTFRAALLRGDDGAVKQTTAAMFAKSGAVERGKK